MVEKAFEMGEPEIAEYSVTAGSEAATQDDDAPIAQVDQASEAAAESAVAPKPVEAAPEAEDHEPDGEEDAATVPESVRAHSQAVRYQMRKGADFTKALSVEVERALRYGRPLSLVIIRAERAKRAHSTLWDTQRRVLFAELEERAILTLRTPDFFAKVSERDFAIALPETQLEDARRVAGKLRSDPMILALEHRLGQGVCGIDWRVLPHDASAGETAEAYLARAIREFDAAAEPALKAAG